MPTHWETTTSTPETSKIEKNKNLKPVFSPLIRGRATVKTELDLSDAAKVAMNPERYARDVFRDVPLEEMRAKLGADIYLGPNTRDSRSTASSATPSNASSSENAVTTKLTHYSSFQQGCQSQQQQASSPSSAKEQRIKALQRELALLQRGDGLSSGLDGAGGAEADKLLPRIISYHAEGARALDDIEQEMFQLGTMTMTRSSVFAHAPMGPARRARGGRRAKKATKGSDKRTRERKQESPRIRRLKKEKAQRREARAKRRAEAVDGGDVSSDTWSDHEEDEDA